MCQEYLQNFIIQAIYDIMTARKPYNSFNFIYLLSIENKRYCIASGGKYKRHIKIPHEPKGMKSFDKVRPSCSKDYKGKGCCPGIFSFCLSRSTLIFFDCGKTRKSALIEVVDITEIIN